MANSKVPVVNGGDSPPECVVDDCTAAGVVDGGCCSDGYAVAFDDGRDRGIVVYGDSQCVPDHGVVSNANSKVPVREDWYVPPEGSPQEQPCGCSSPGTTIIEVISGQGGMVNDYTLLSGKPSIEEVVLVGNRHLEEFGFGTATRHEVHQLFA